MDNLLDIFLRLARYAYPVKYKLRGQLDSSYTDTFTEESSVLIRKRLADDKPLMVSRFGSTELNCVINYLNQRESFKELKFITGQIDYHKWNESVLNNICTLSGFFPKDVNLISQFCELMLEDMSQIDILGSWLKEEALFSSKLKNAIKVGITNLEPYNHRNPWSEELEGKTVLVVHPYDKSIKNQYKKREYLFKDKRVLPGFELKTIKAVQSISNNKTYYASWFDALEDMKEQIMKTTFDVAIIGCGAYGLPLAAFVKRIGKKAVHLGGSSQLLFGITGKRWEDNYLDYKARLINEHWSRPLDSEVPENFKKVEDGCYW